MSLEPGTTLGPYKILSPIGAGGMGEVYKARDTRLDRTVAIKVLPEHVASDPELKQRFEREAKTISSLNHPHICTLHDIGSQDGIDFLVMEYLEGDTLAQRLTKGQLPTAQVLKIAAEIADALDKAHRQGITHRDLKPGNIMLTKSGAKLLDFGLAKLRQPGTVGSDGFSAAVTQSEPLTGRGTILGTLQYMAPEQLEGKEADHRTDIFAFGAVVYEIATGQRAFAGDSQASLISAIMSGDPQPMSTLQAMTPPALDYVVKTCLAKAPDERWQSAGDVGRQVRGIIEGGSQPGIAAPVATEPERSSWRRWPIAPGSLNDFVWSRDGKELFYRERRDQGGIFSGQGEVFMMAVSIDPDPASSSPVGVPRPLFKDTRFIQDIGRHFDIATDGRFLMLKGGIDSAEPQYISVVRNWSEALKERAPVN